MCHTALKCKTKQNKKSYDVVVRTRESIDYGLTQRNDWHFHGYPRESQTKENPMCKPIKVGKYSSYYQLTELGLSGIEY